MKIVVGARNSPLSQAQVKEVGCFFPELTFVPKFVETKGDKDQKTSLRGLEKTNFFTEEVDTMLLNGECDIAIHSAKDLPEPLPEGISLIALTEGVDASDSLVLRTHEQLTPGMCIATSSIRREEMVKTLCKELKFVDIRGTIEKRLEQLTERCVDGVVVAEAALIRLGLTHLNRIALPGETAPLQGKLALLARSDDDKMLEIFKPIDSRCVSSI